MTECSLDTGSSWGVEVHTKFGGVYMLDEENLSMETQGVWLGDAHGHVGTSECIDDVARIFVPYENIDRVEVMSWVTSK